MNISKKLDGLGITTLGIAFTLYLYADLNEEGFIGKEGLRWLVR